MLKIRLQRVGRVHEPTFRVVLTDSRNSTKSGRFLEVLGHHDPRGERVGALDKDRILHLISKGAQPTATMHNLLVKKGIVKGTKIDVSAKKKKKDGETETEVSGDTKAETPETEVPKEVPVEAIKAELQKSSDKKGAEEKEEQKTEMKGEKDEEKKEETVAPAETKA